MNKLEPMSDWQKREQKMDTKIIKLGEKKDAPQALKKLAKKTKRDEDMDVDISIARRVFDQCLEEYRNGEYDWKEFVKGVYDGLRIIK